MRTPRFFNGVFRSSALTLVLGIIVVMTARPASAATDASSRSPKATQGEGEVAEEEGPLGVFLGEYFIRDIHESENAKTRLSFSLYAAVDPQQEKAFVAVLARHQSRVHDLVLTAIRLSDNHDFQEPSLERLKWRMLLRLRRGLPQLKIEHLHFRRFVFFID